MFDLSSSWVEGMHRELTARGYSRDGKDHLRQDPRAETGHRAVMDHLPAPAIKKLMAEDGPLQPSLFDNQDPAEISHPDYPGERLIACRDPLLAAERARKREGLLTATETKVAGQAAAGRIRGADKIGIRAGRVEPEGF
jgi:hypothetical protein